jgi:hypothetical protein
MISLSALMKRSDTTPLPVPPTGVGVVVALPNGGTSTVPSSPESPSSMSDGGSDTDISQSLSNNDSGSDTYTSRPTFSQSNRSSSSKKTQLPPSSTAGSAEDEKAMKEMLRKERKREAVRRCRKRKREAALKLEAQLKFQRRRQEVLVREVQKKTFDGAGAVHDPDFSQLRCANAVQMAMQTGHPGYRQHFNLRDQALATHLTQAFVQAETQRRQEAMLASKILQATSHSGISVSNLTWLLQQQRAAEHRQQQAAYSDLLNARQFVGATPTPPRLAAESRARENSNPLLGLLAVAEAQQQMQSFSQQQHKPPTASSPVNPHAVALPESQVQAAANTRKPATKRPRASLTGETDDEKEARRKERKREAVRRCRLRKRQQHEQLEEETKKLQQQNERLQRLAGYSPCLAGYGTDRLNL